MKNHMNETPEQELARLRKENEALRAVSVKKLSFKVSEKGGLSVYGLGRFPVTLYKEQWARLIELAPAIQEFIKTNDEQLKSKADSVIAKAQTA